MVVNQFFDAVRDAPEEFFAVEDGGDFPADIVEQRERIVLVGWARNRLPGTGSASPTRNGVSLIWSSI